MAFIDTQTPRISCVACKRTYGAAGWSRGHTEICPNTNHAHLIKKYRKLKTLQCGPKGRNIPFNLTDDDIATLLSEAGIEVTDIGKSSGKYCLARYNDEGPYEMGNCRFVTFAQNLSEKKHSVENRRKLSERMTAHWKELRENKQ